LSCGSAISRWRRDAKQAPAGVNLERTAPRRPYQILRIFLQAKIRIFGLEAAE